MKKGLLALGAIGLLAVSGYAQENYATWTGSRSIVINTTATGANVANAVTNYPVLVRLTSSQSDVFTTGGSNGASIRFTAADGTTRLQHERERWDSAGKAAEFWVLVPSVAGNANTTIKMFYGKVGAADSSKSTAVFDTTTTGNAFRAVYHMNAGSGVATEKDATALANNLAASDSTVAAIPTDTVGAIGRARTFKGDTTTVDGRQYFVAPGTRAKPELNWGPTNPHTVSAWAYARTTIGIASSGNSIFNKGDNQYALQIYGTATNKKWESAVYTSTWRQIPSSSLNVATNQTGAWYFVTGTWSGGATSTNATAQMYVNGVLDTTASLGIGTGNAYYSWNLFVGANPNGGGLNSVDSAVSGGTTRSMTNAPTRPGRARYWDGHLDEIRLARGVRSADWIKLDFETQKPTSTSVTVGNNITPVVATRDWNPGFAIRNSGANFVFSVPGAAHISVLDIKGREVWSRSTAQAADVSWNGLSVDGSRLSGIHVARVTARVNGVETTVAQRSFSMVK